MTSITSAGDPATAFPSDRRPISADGTTSRPHGNSNPVVLTIDGRPISITGRQLADQDVRQQFAELFGDAQRIIFEDWQCVVNQPSEVHDFFLEQYQATPEVWEYQIAGRTSGFLNPFEATLNCLIDRDNITLVRNATSLAINAASIVCPTIAQEAGVQIREWLMRNGVRSETARSIASRVRANSPEPNGNERLNPQDAARLVLGSMQEERESRGEEITTPPVRYYQNEFYVWDGTQWKEHGTFELEVVRRLQGLVETTALTSGFVKSVMTNIQGFTYLNHTEVPIPFRVEDETTRQLSACQVLNCGNGLVDIGGFGNANDELRLEQHSPQIFGAPLLNYQFDPTATCPLWLQTLGEIFAIRATNDNRIAILQEYFGYCLLVSNHRFETFLILIGDGANGKSVILEVLRAMLGTKNVSNVPLDAFEGQFSKAEMIGKLANIATDMQRMPRVQEGTLKQMVSGEPIQIDQKYKPATTAYPTAKLVFATNHLPPFADTTDGLWRRMIVIPFFIQFVADQIDRYRARSIITEELSGVLNWSLEGARRLLSQDAFTRCGVCESAKSDHRHDSDPFSQFLDECCELGPDHSVIADELYTAYAGFCRASGKGAKARPEIGKQLAKLQGVTRRRESQVARRYYVYDGIRLLPTVLMARTPTFDPRHREYHPAHPMNQDLRRQRNVPESQDGSPGTSPADPDNPHREEDVGHT